MIARERAIIAIILAGAQGRTLIAADSSTWFAYLHDVRAQDTLALDRALADRRVQMAPAVLCELHSALDLSPSTAILLDSIPLSELAPGYWKRTGQLRAAVLTRGRKARLGDALIAQFCLDHHLDLLGRDHDVTAFAEIAPLRVLTFRSGGNGSADCRSPKRWP